MKLYKPRNQVSRYYNFLFALPRPSTLLAFFSVSLLLSVMWLRRGSLPYVASALALQLTLFLYAHLNRESAFHKLSRRVGLGLAAFIYSISLGLATGKWHLGVGASSSIVYVAVLGIDGTRAARYLVGLSPALITSFIWLAATGDYIPALYCVAISAAFGAMDAAIYLYLSRRKVGGYPSTEWGTLFLKNWLDKRRDIEKAFELISEPVIVRPRLFKLGDLYLVYTDIHYGPFSNVGSGDFPEIIASGFAERGMRAVCLHGFGSHDRDLATSEQSRRLAERILASLEEPGWEPLKLKCAKAFSWSGYSVLLLGLEGAAMAFVSRPGAGIDDPPYYLQTRIEDMLNGRGDAVLIDSHNWELILDHNEGAPPELAGAIASEISKCWDEAPGEVMYKYECFESDSPGLIKGEGCVIEIRKEGSGEGVVLIYLRGNNITPGARDEIVGAVKGVYGNILAEVFTNDEHTETGTLASFVYIPIHPTPTLLSSVERACRALINRPYDRGLYYRRLEAGARILGKGSDELKELLRKSFAESFILLITYAFVIPWLLTPFV